MHCQTSGRGGVDCRGSTARLGGDKKGGLQRAPLTDQENRRVGCRGLHCQTRREQEGWVTEGSTDRPGK